MLATESDGSSFQRYETVPTRKCVISIQCKIRASKLCLLYDAGVPVLDLASQQAAPPLNVFRAILTGRGFSKLRIKEYLKDKVEDITSISIFI